MTFVFGVFFPAFAALAVVWIARGMSQVAYAAGDILKVNEEAPDVVTE